MAATDSKAEVAPKDDRPFQMWYIEQCPAPHPCSKSAWDRAKKCESWANEDDCIDKLQEHLEKSAYHHSLTKEERDEILDTAVVKVYVPTAEEKASWEECCKAEAAKSASNGTTAKAEAVKVAKVRETESHGTTAKANAKGRSKARTPSQSPKGGASKKRREKSPPQPSSTTLAVAGPRAAASSGADDLISVPRSKLLAVLDHIDRCTAGLRSARDMAEAASTAFETEMKKMREVRRELNHCLEGVNLG